MSEAPKWSTDLGSRVPPHNLDAEQSVLGSMMLSGNAVADVIEVVRAEDFYRPAHETIFACIYDIYTRGETPDSVIVANTLQKQGELTRIGGAAYLHTLVSSVPTASSGAYYATIVREQAVLRGLVEAGTRIVQMGYEGSGETDELVNRAQAELFDITEQRTAENYKSLSEIIPTAMDEIQRAGDRGSGPAGVPTGFDDFDELTHGLHPGQMIVIASRPGMGKSTLALDFARNAAVANSMATAFFSLEMGAMELTIRLLSAETDINLQTLRKGTLTSGEWTRIAQKITYIEDKPLFIDDSPNLDMAQIRTKCRRLKQRHDLKMIVIDYLQLLSSSRRVESRQQEVSEFSRSLKLLAKELEVPVIALSQLNRSSEQRQDGRPAIADLRESGSIEQDADMVLLIYREDQYKKDSEHQGEGEIIIAKHRNGPTGSVHLSFKGSTSRFANMGRF